MDDQNATAMSSDENVNPSESPLVSKGKEKAISNAQYEVMSMDEDEDSSDEETGAEEDAPEDATEDLDDEEGEIDPTQILSSRTRGKNIDFAKAAAEAGDDLQDDDDDDDDFEEPIDEDAMEE